MSSNSDSAGFHDIDPPIRVAWSQAVASIRVRFLRQSLTMLGILLGIAFFACVQVIQSTGSKQPSDVDRFRWLVATSLLMCLVGVTNSMLISVAERYREIGTIKCLGASDGFIVKVFLLESLLLGSAGSVTGSLLGTGLGVVVQSSQGPPVSGSALLRIVLEATVIGIVMTVVAAMAPAVQAARMPAAAALRVEI